jgi:hypothetical protein
MNKNVFIIILFCISTMNLFAQDKSSRQKKYKHEFESDISFLGSSHSEFGAEFIFRRNIGTKYKLGGGVKLVLGGLNTPVYHFFPAIQLDAERMIGPVQKWGISIRPGYSFFSRQDGKWPGYDPVKGPYQYSITEKMGPYLLTGVNYRKTISGKLHFITGLFASFQYVRTKYFHEYTANPGQINISNWNRVNPGGGIRIGLIF